jgi:hypothetical protein
MQSAKQSLQQQDSGSAQQSEEKAVEELDKAEKDLQDRLAEINKEEQLEKLLQLAEALDELIKREEKIYESTKELEGKKEQGWLRADKVRLKQLAKEQNEVRNVAGELVKTMREEKSVIYPGVLEQARFDMAEAAELLDNSETGDYTQYLEEQILKRLRDLAAALRREYEAKKQQGGQQQGQQGGGKKPPLVPPVAELKMLRNMEDEIHKETVRLEQTLEALKSAGQQPGPFQKQMLRRLLHQQSNVRELANQMIEDLKKRAAEQGRAPGPGMPQPPAPREKQPKEQPKEGPGEEEP